MESSEYITNKWDLGCVVCTKTAFADGKPTGIKLKSCTVCPSPRQYCSKRCFERDWKDLGHRDECKLYTSSEISEDLDQEKKKIVQLKKKADLLCSEMKYEDAILMYTTVKINAIKIIQFLKDDAHEHGNKIIEEHVLEDYLEGVDELHPKLVNDLKYKAKPHPLIVEMSELSSTAANKMAFIYSKLEKWHLSSGCCREALKLDPLSADKILPQMIIALRLTSLPDDLFEMEVRYAAYHSARKIWPVPMALLESRFISYKQYLKLSKSNLYRIINKEKRRLKHGKQEFINTDFKDSKKWGQVTVFASMLPLNGKSGISLGFTTTAKDIDECKYFNLRVKLTDSSDSLDDNFVENILGDSSLTSHEGTTKALRIAHRETILFIHDVEHEGLLVNFIWIGIGLFNFFPQNQDPYKEERKGTKKTEKYILSPGYLIPKHCKPVPAMENVEDYENMFENTK